MLGQCVSVAAVLIAWAIYRFTGGSAIPLGAAVVRGTVEERRGMARTSFHRGVVVDL